MPIKRYREHVPSLARGVWLAETAAVSGDVVIGEYSNIWYGCVLRGDVGRVRIGKRVNIQDLSCVHMTEGLSDAVIEDDASVGHGAIIHGAIIETGVLVGMGSVVMDNARIGAESVLGAGSLVTAGTIIPPGSLALGRPARVVRRVTDEERSFGRKTAEKYVLLAREHASVPLGPPGP